MNKTVFDAVQIYLIWRAYMTVKELIDELKTIDPLKEVKMKISDPSVNILTDIDWVQENNDSVSLHWQFKFGEDD